MKKVPSFLILLSFTPVALAQTEEGGRLSPVLERSSWVRQTDLLLYKNPAVHWNRYSSSLSSVSGNYETVRKDRYLMETGNSWNGGSFQADSYTQVGSQAVVWGNAVYRNGQHKALRWNETADYERIYPYVTADSIGGTMQGETYYFQGGYAARTGRWSYGLQMTYQSESAYRTRDPRPKNDVGLINASIGAARDLNTRYALGIYGFAEKYNLNQSVQFMNPRGKSPLYHLTGPGMDYVRFQGDYNASVYKGRTLAAGLTLSPVQSEGFSLAVYLEQFKVQKQLVLTSTYLPLNDIRQTVYSGELFYRWKRAWVKAGASYRHRIGKERIYDDGTQNYHEISASEPFQDKVFTADAEAACEWLLPASFTLGVRPSVEFVSTETTYALPYRRMILRTLTPEADVHVLKPLKKMLLEVGVNLHAVAVLNSSLYLEDTETFSRGLEAVKHDFEALSAGGTGFEVYACWHLALNRFLRTVYLKPSYTSDFYKNGWKNYGLLLSLGVTI